MKLSKPKLTKCRASELWMCDGGYTTYASTPEKAYSDWLAKETEEPHHLYSKRSIRELIVRMEKHKKENPEMFEEKVYSGRPSAPEPPEPRNLEFKAGGSGKSYSVAKAINMTSVFAIACGVSSVVIVDPMIKDLVFAFGVIVYGFSLMFIGTKFDKVVEGR